MSGDMSWDMRSLLLLMVVKSKSTRGLCYRSNVTDYTRRTQKTRDPPSSPLQSERRFNLPFSVHGPPNR